eukprot:1368195-Rhodomonas_salina.3
MLGLCISFASFPSSALAPNRMFEKTHYEISSPMPRIETCRHAMSTSRAYELCHTNTLGPQLAEEVENSLILLLLDSMCGAPTRKEQSRLLRNLTRPVLLLHVQRWQHERRVQSHAQLAKQWLTPNGPPLPLRQGTARASPEGPLYQREQCEHRRCRWCQRRRGQLGPSWLALAAWPRCCTRRRKGMRLCWERE